MARKAGKRFKFDIRPVIDFLGLAEFIRQVGQERMLKAVAARIVKDKKTLNRVIERITLERIVANLSPAKRRELKRLLQ